MKTGSIAAALALLAGLSIATLSAEEMNTHDDGMKKMDKKMMDGHEDSQMKKDMGKKMGMEKDMMKDHPADTMKGGMKKMGMDTNASMAKPMKEMDSRMMMPPFGSAKDIAFAEEMWKKLHAAGFDALHANLYVGGPPHGKVREAMEGILDGHLVIAKTNYGGKDVTIDNVKADPKKYLKAVTVMVKRPGYDSDDQDWFWAKYKPDGTLFANDKGVKLAGRVAKGKPVGCISCHQSASGSDFVFSHNKTVNAAVTWIGDKSQMESVADLMK